MLNCVEAGKPPTALADARQVSEPGDGGATSPAITAVIGERVRDDAGRHQSLFESALLAEIKELKRAISAQQANYARFMENVGHAVVSGSNSLSRRPIATRPRRARRPRTHTRPARAVCYATMCVVIYRMSEHTHTPSHRIESNRHIPLVTRGVRRYIPYNTPREYHQSSNR